MMDEKFLKTISLLFNREVKADEKFSMADNGDEWTSLKHIEIIMTLEEDYEIVFEPEEIPTLTSLQALYLKVMELAHGS